MVMKHWPPEFKADAVALYQSRPGATIRSVAADRGVNPETLRNWVRGRGEPAEGRRTEAPVEPPTPLEAGERGPAREGPRARRGARDPAEGGEVFRRGDALVRSRQPTTARFDVAFVLGGRALEGFDRAGWVGPPGLGEDCGDFGGGEGRQRHGPVGVVAQGVAVSAEQSGRQGDGVRRLRTTASTRWRSSRKPKPGLYPRARPTPRAGACTATVMARAASIAARARAVRRGGRQAKASGISVGTAVGWRAAPTLEERAVSPATPAAPIPREAGHRPRGRRPARAARPVCRISRVGLSRQGKVSSQAPSRHRRDVGTVQGRHAADVAQPAMH